MNIDTATSTIHGKGVFAREPIRKGYWQWIYGYAAPYAPGRVDARYGFWLGEYKLFVPYAPFCYLNHCIEPNCEVEWDKDDRPVLFALRRIKAGEELTLDYGEEPDET